MAYDWDLRLESSVALFLPLLLLSSAVLPQNAFANPQETSTSSAALPSPQALVQQVVQNEIRAQNDDSTHWRFCRTTAKAGRSKAWDVIETREGQVRRLVAIDGHPLNAEQQRAEQQRIQQFLGDRAGQEKTRRTSSSDYKEEQQLMRMLPDALLYTCGGRQGDLVTLNFTPNPRFHATTREAEVFHHMAGVLIIDVKNKRLAEFRGQLTSGVKFGYGILGYLNEGGTFDVKQQDVANRHWDVTLLETNITGKELFFKSIAIQEKIVESGYHRVSDNLTLQQAASMLRTQGTESASLSKTALPARLGNRESLERRNHR